MRKMSINKANTILQQLFLALYENSGDFMSRFLCLPAAEPSWERAGENVSIVLRQCPWHPGGGLLGRGRQGTSTLVPFVEPLLCSWHHTLCTHLH